MAAKVCSWCLKLAEIKGRGVVCEVCLLSAYDKSVQKDKKIGENLENKKLSIQKS